MHNHRTQPHSLATTITDNTAQTLDSHQAAAPCADAHKPHISLATLAIRPETTHLLTNPSVSPKTRRSTPCTSVKTRKVLTETRYNRPVPSCTQSQQPCPSLRRRFVSSAPRSCIALLANCIIFMHPASSSQQTESVPPLTTVSHANASSSRTATHGR